MKEIYLHKAIFGSSYNFSEKKNATAAEQENFENYSEFLDYLASPEMKKTRKRNQVVMKVSGVNEAEFGTLEKDLAKLEFKGEVVLDK